MEKVLQGVANPRIEDGKRSLKQPQQLTEPEVHLHLASFESRERRLGN